MTVKEFKDIINEMEVENGVEIRIVDQYDEEKDTYYHNSVDNIEITSDSHGKYLILSSKEGI